MDVYVGCFGKLRLVLPVVVWNWQCLLFGDRSLVVLNLLVCWVQTGYKSIYNGQNFFVRESTSRFKRKQNLLHWF